MILDITLGPEFHLKIGFKQPWLENYKRYTQCHWKCALWADYGCCMVLYGMQNGKWWHIQFQVVLKMFGLTRAFCKFKIINFKDDIRNLNSIVQYRSDSAKALHIENEKTDSNYFGHLHGTLVCVGWSFKFAWCYFPSYCLKNHYRKSIHHQQMAASS